MTSEGFNGIRYSDLMYIAAYISTQYILKVVDDNMFELFPLVYSTKRLLIKYEYRKIKRIINYYCVYDEKNIIMNYFLICLY